ncbi:MAG TPA: preprotein translocase subunit SecG [Opitutaceae bacterium]|jgi:preprotein translocase subunit SecG|nr:preprotein translocase subunit SecG [Opitutaceae bacterium]
MSIVLTILTFVLILVSLFLILVILMQPAQTDGGMGASMGGGMAEATFGAQTSSVLSKATINASIAFFVLSLGLYLGWIYQMRHAAAKAGNALPTIGAPAQPALPPLAPIQPKPATAAPVVPAAPATAPLSTAPKP